MTMAAARNARMELWTGLRLARGQDDKWKLSAVARGFSVIIAYERLGLGNMVDDQRAFLTLGHPRPAGYPAAAHAHPDIAVGAHVDHPSGIFRPAAVAADDDIRPFPLGKRQHLRSQFAGSRADCRQHDHRAVGGAVRL